MNNHGGSKTEAVVKLTLIFFISLFSFSVGTFVGKQISDSDRRRVALEAEYEQVNTAANHTKEEMKGAITEEDVNRLTKEFVDAEKELSKHNEQKTAEAKAEAEEAQARTVASAKPEVTEDGFVKRERKAEPAQEKKPAKETPVAKTEPMKKQADNFKPESVPTAIKRVAEGKAPTKNEKPKRKLASTLPALSPTSVGKFTVQIASYATEKEAKSHAKKLKGDGYSAFYLSAKVKGNTWYRVSVGLFDSRKSANNFKTELMKQASIKSAIVQKIIR